MNRFKKIVYHTKKRRKQFVEKSFISDKTRTKMNKFDLIIGIDEVGIGAIFGPATVGMAVFPKEHQKFLVEIKDSKKYTTVRSREKAEKVVKEHALFWDVEHIAVEDLEALGQGKAVNQAMQRLAERALERFPKALVIVDGKIPITGLHADVQATQVKADITIQAVSAASILAKCARDRLVTELASGFHEYNLHKNKGYFTQRHREALKKLGPTKLHRFYIKSVQDAYQRLGYYEDRHVEKVI